MKLKLSSIRIDGGTQARVALNEDKVREYADKMKDGHPFDPAKVMFDGSDYWLVDGFHRYFACKQNAFPDIECTVTEGTLRDAQWASFGANAGHGLQYTRDDIRTMVERILADEEWNKHSNNEIAKHVGCSAMTVGRIKKSFEEAQQPEEGEEDKPEVVVYTNKHGQQAEMKVDKVGKKQEDKAPVDLGAPPPMPEEDEKEQQIKELEFQVSELAEENQKLKDAIAVGQFDGSDIEKADIEDTIKDLREQLRVKDIEIASLRESRDTYQNRAAELMKQVKALQAKLKKAGIE